MRACWVVGALLLFAVILSSTFLESATATADISGFCDPKCAVRCSKSGRPKLCLKYCGICCRECNCVPPGTYGNKDMCPCYRDKLSSKGTPKCP